MCTGFPSVYAVEGAGYVIRLFQKDTNWSVALHGTHKLIIQYCSTLNTDQIPDVFVVWSFIGFVHLYPSAAACI